MLSIHYFSKKVSFISLLMANTSNLVQVMNNISQEDEEEGGFQIEEEILVENNQQYSGFNVKFFVVGRFITEGKVDFAAMQHTMASL